MKSRLSKFIKRLRTVSLYGLGKLITVVFQLVLSLVIIKIYSSQLWGEYVELLMWTNLIAILANFGNREYLLKIFSEKPSEIYKNWVGNFTSRLLLFGISVLCIIALPFFEGNIELIIIWTFLLFYNQSFDVLILYHRKFVYNIFSELLRMIIVLGWIFFYPDLLTVKTLLVMVIVGTAVKAICNTLYFSKQLKNTPISMDMTSLRKSFPFFIPMILGTIRTKIDAYYGTVYFSKTDLSKYQVFINMLALVQMGASYVINPFINTFYRMSDKTRGLLEKQASYIGWAIAIIALPIVYAASTGLYGYNYSVFSYVSAFLFIITLFIHILLINEFYQKNKQMQVAIIIGITATVQLILGYFVIEKYQIEGGLAIKTLGQWIMVIALFIYKKRVFK